MSERQLLITVEYFDTENQTLAHVNQPAIPQVGELISFYNEMYLVISRAWGFIGLDMDRKIGGGSRTCVSITVKKL